MRLLWYLIIMIGSAIGIFVPLTVWLNTQENVDQKLLDSLNLYLLAGFIVEGIILFFVGDLIQKKRDIQQDRKDHTKDLVNEVFRYLTNIYLRQKWGSQELEFKVYRNYDQLRSDKLDLQVISGGVDLIKLMSINRLRQPYYGWAFKHLEKYPCYKIWKRANELLNEYNITQVAFNDSIEDAIRNDMNEEFPNLTQYSEFNRGGNTYFLREIKDRIIEAFGENMTSQTHQQFTEIILDRNNILPTGFGQSPYIVGNVNEESLQQFRNMLIRITTDSNFVQRFEYLDKTRTEIINQIQSFESEIEMLIGKFEGGILIEGKCERGL